MDDLRFYRYVLRFWRPLLRDLWLTLAEWRRQRAWLLRNGYNSWRTR
jgi:hypothetical protein